MVQRVTRHPPVSRCISIEARDQLSRSELQYLTNESDPQLFYESLLNLGMRLEARDQLAGATAVYEAILRECGMPNSEGGISKFRTPHSELRTLAQERLDAIHGVGSSALRLEFNFRRIGHEAASPTGLFAMGAAGAAFKLTKLATLSRLATTPMGFLGRQAIAHSVAFFAETATFTLAGKTAAQIAGIKQDWRPKALAHEWAGGAAMLLGLKAMGGLAGLAGRRIALGEGALERFSRAALPQIGMFSGIMLGNKLSELGHFREQHDNATSLTDSLLTLLQFNVSGQLLQGALGEKYQRFEQRVELQSDALVGQRRGNGDTGIRGMGDFLRLTVLPSHHLIPQGAKAVQNSEFRVPSEDLQASNSMRMSIKKNEKEHSSSDRLGGSSEWEITKSGLHSRTPQRTSFLRLQSPISRGIPILAKDPSQLPRLLHLAVQKRFSGEGARPIIIERPMSFNLDPGILPLEIVEEKLNQWSQDLRKEFEEGTRFELLVAADQRSFRGRVEGGILVWTESSGHSWSQARLKAMRSEVEIDSVTELYQFLQALKTGEKFSSSSDWILFWKGAPPRTFENSLENFVWHVLNHYEVGGNSVFIRFESGKATLLFQSEGGIWKYPETFSVPPPPPVITLAPPAQRFGNEREVPVAFRRSSIPPTNPTNAQAAYEAFAKARTILSVRPGLSKAPAEGSSVDQRLHLLTSLTELFAFVKGKSNSGHHPAKVEVWLDLPHALAENDLIRLCADLQPFSLRRSFILHEGFSQKTHIFQRGKEGVESQGVVWHLPVSWRNSQRDSFILPPLEAKGLAELFQQLTLLRGLGLKTERVFRATMSAAGPAVEISELITQKLSRWSDFPFSELQLQFLQRGSRFPQRQIFRKNAAGLWQAVI